MDANQALYEAIYKDPRGYRPEQVLAAYQAGVVPKDTAIAGLADTAETPGERAKSYGLMGATAGLIGVLGGVPIARMAGIGKGKSAKDWAKVLGVSLAYHPALWGGLGAGTGYASRALGDYNKEEATKAKQMLDAINNQYQDPLQ